MQGFLNLNKPAGWTSHDCVAKVRKLLRQKRVGHGGTLDPAAIGVLPMAIGRATRLLDYLSPTKAYRAVVRFGLITSTDDLEGEILQQAPAEHLTLAQVEALLPKFMGTIDQIPPKYSAIQVNGQRLYDLARAGKPVDVPVRQVTVSQINLLGWRSQPFPEIELEITCGTGTYIRAIARDLGHELGTGATLAHLTRTQSSGFSLDHSLTFDQLHQQVGQQTEQQTLALIPPEVALAHLPILTLPDDLARRWQQGQKLAIASPPGIYRIHLPDHTFLGIGEQTDLDPSLRAKVVYLPAPQASLQQP